LEHVVQRQLDDRVTDLHQLALERALVLDQIVRARTAASQEEESVLEQRHLVIRRHEKMLLEHVRFLQHQYAHARLLRVQLRNLEDQRAVLRAGQTVASKVNPTERERDVASLSEQHRDLGSRFRELLEGPIVAAPPTDPFAAPEEIARNHQEIEAALGTKEVRE
jgi:hypothetical protein